MPVFVLEIGTEELPARFLPGVEKELTDKFAAALIEAGLDYGPFTVCSTPRRQMVYIEDLSPRSRESEDVVTGPPLRVAFDTEGNPTKAALGFAKTQGVDFYDTFTQKTDKGEYLAAKVKSGGESAMDIFQRLCPAIVGGLSFPKRMHWAVQDFTFARPLRWLLALLDSNVVDFQVGDISSGRETRGHRVHGFGPFVLKKAKDYFDVIHTKGKITLSGKDRATTIVTAGDELAAKAGGKILWKDSLLEEVSGLTEHPVPLLGSFDESFLEVPREVLITSMESHQKSFGLEGTDAKLLPHFLTVLNITPKDEELVRKGWERVLRARLEDARFFWHTDLNSNFENWLARLDKVIFLAGIGSVGEKTRRIGELAGWLAETCAAEFKEAGVSKTDAARAGLLSKADLVTEMVGEFDTLQGIMGSIYAAKKGENTVVSAALAEQYLPAGPDSPLPETMCGAFISIADKADTLAGCFGLGLIPTGAADPYALRRAALGIARIMGEKKIRLDVRRIFQKALELYGERQWKLSPIETLDKLSDFFSLRLKNYFTGQGAETLLVESVISAGFGDIWGASQRLAALRRFAAKPSFNEAVLTFKRPANIIRKQGDDKNILTGKFDSALLQEAAEKELADTLKKLEPKFQALHAADDYDALFDLLYQLKPIVDGFFIDVMVMCEDEKLRSNRLNLLYALVSQLKGLADFDAMQL